MNCPHHTDAGAYLLAALSPVERAAFQTHLADCADCQLAVRELAELPGLLSRVPESGTAGPPLADPPPSILAGLLSQVSRRRTNRLVLATCAAVVTVLAFVGVAMFALDGSEEPSPPVATGDAPTRTIAMQLAPGSSYNLQASLDLTPRPWGTEIKLHCSYFAEHGTPVYILFGRSGAQDHELARWSAPAGQEVQLSAASDIRSFDTFEIRTTYGRVLMRGGP